MTTASMFSDSEILEYLQGSNEKELFDKAYRCLAEGLGTTVLYRGLIEISNYCRNNCLYCGIRAGNTSASRYRLDKEEILGCCKRAVESGYGTFVLQGGEDNKHSIEWLENLVKTIHSEYPNHTITLSLGEKSKDDYIRLYEAGARRYLLRHETATRQHYYQLHPDSMSFENRMECLRNLKEIGYETGAGMMIGSPYQTYNHLLSDLRFLENFQPDMVGVGPFINADNTPFSDYTNTLLAPDDEASIRLTLRVIALVRLLVPKANIPATTALFTLGKSITMDECVKAGANVRMFNVSPEDAKEKYNIYNGKSDGK